jgi:hypothetical protein
MTHVKNNVPSSYTTCHCFKSLITDWETEYKIGHKYKYKILTSIDGEMRPILINPDIGIDTIPLQVFNDHFQDISILRNELIDKLL